MTADIYVFPTPPKKVAFTPAERAALITCADGLPSGVVALFDQDDDDGEQFCSFIPVDNGCSVAFVGIQNGAMTLWDGPTKALVTTRDVRVIVAAIVNWKAEPHRSGPAQPALVTRLA